MVRPFYINYFSTWIPGLTYDCALFFFFFLFCFVLFLCPLQSSFRKEQLKTLMKAHQIEKEKKGTVDTASSGAPVVSPSPLAQVNKAGQLVCILCKVLVKETVLWDAHCQSKGHRQNLLALKEAKARRDAAAAANASKSAAPVPATVAAPTSSAPSTAPVPEGDDDDDGRPGQRGLLEIDDDDADNRNEQNPAADPPALKKRKSAETDADQGQHEPDLDGYDDDAIAAIPPELLNVYTDEELQSELVGAPRIQFSGWKFDPREVEREFGQLGENDDDDDESNNADAASALPSGFFDAHKTAGNPRTAATSAATRTSSSPAAAPRVPSAPSASRAAASAQASKPARANKKDADAELRSLFTAIKRSDIDFDALQEDDDSSASDDDAAGSMELGLAETDVSARPLPPPRVVPMNLVPSKPEKDEAASAESSEADEADLDELLDWRAR
jgi:hypothetical protein